MIEQQQPYINQRQATAYPLPPPNGGWNARNTLYDMSPNEAIKLVNWFPDRDRVAVRAGHASHSTGLGSGVVETLMPYYKSDGTARLLGAANNNIYNATSSSASSLKASLSNNRWQFHQFADTLVMVNGEDQPLQYDGSTISDATFTGISDDSVLTDLTSYRNRQYFIEGTSVWYAGLDAVTGALTEFDVGSLLRFGGSLNSITTWSKESGNSFDEYLVLLSSQGEGLIYSGSDPGNANWTLAFRFKIPPPMGVRAFLTFGSDVYVLNRQGIYPLSRVVSEGIEPGVFERVSDKIQIAFGEAARSYGGNWGWQMENYPQGHYLLANIPIASGSTARQYVMNTETGAWCEFRGQDAQSWGVYNNDLYFGGTDGTVYKADTGNDDSGNFIEAEMQQAFTYLDDRSRNKHITQIRPVFEADSTVTIGVDIDVDFATSPMLNTETIQGTGGTSWTGTSWTGTPWGATSRTIDDWYGVGKYGRSVSVKYKGKFKDVSVGLSSTDVWSIVGGIL